MNDLQICQLINRTKLSSEKKRLLLFRASFDESPARKNYISKLLSSIKSLKRRRKEKSKDDHEEWNRRITQQFFIPSDVLFAMSFVPNICRKKEKKNRKTSVNRWGGRIVGKEKKRRRHRRQERAEKQSRPLFEKRILNRDVLGKNLFNAPVIHSLETRLKDPFLSFPSLSFLFAQVI